MIAIKLKHISYAATLWAVEQTSDKVHGYFSNVHARGWVPDRAGKASMVGAMSTDEVWCVNGSHEIWRLQHAEGLLGLTGVWSKVPTLSGKTDAATIAAAADGSVWYADTHDGSLYWRENNVWHKDPTGHAAIIAVGSRDNVWCTNSEGSVFRRANGAWTKDATATQARTIAAAADGTVWYGNASGQLFRREGSGWVKDATGRGTIVTVGSATEVYCLNADGDVYHRAPTGWVALDMHILDHPDVYWTHTLLSGETLATIVAKLFHTNDWPIVNRIVAEIARLNGILEKDKVAAGLVLRMPPATYR